LLFRRAPIRVFGNSWQAISKPEARAGPILVTETQKPNSFSPWDLSRPALKRKHHGPTLSRGAEAILPALAFTSAFDTLTLGFSERRRRAIVIIISATAELDKSLIVERVRPGMRRAKLEGRRIGRTPLDVDHAASVRDRLSGMSLTIVAKKHGLSRSSVVRFVRESQVCIALQAAEPG
jgi:hypothetical protein